MCKDARLISKIPCGLQIECDEFLEDLRACIQKLKGSSAEEDEPLLDFAMDTNEALQSLLPFFNPRLVSSHASPRTLVAHVAGQDCFKP
jgi:hypothetical protein